MTTPHRKPTPRKAKRIKATIMWQHCYSKNVFKEENGGSLPVAVLGVSDEQILINQVKLSLDTEDGTGAGYDWAAWKVLHDLGIIKKGFLK